MPWIFAALVLWTATLMQGPMVFSAAAKPPVAPGSYAGTDACRPCHKDLVDEFLKTAHHLDSSLGTPESVLGDFTPGHNRLDTRDPGVFYTMESRPDGLFVVATSGTPPRTRAERIDIVTGSGRKGQTFLFWKNDTLFELPVSIWSAQKAWVNSPGYTSGAVNFDRPVGARCLECHSTYFDARPMTVNAYNKSGYILGIECEKCHGPGRGHIERRSKPPRPAAAADIVNTGKLNRDLQIDLCGTCHAGGIRPTSPAFSFLPGKPLADYFEPVPSNMAPSAEVHGNQVGLMKSSRCYQESGAMTCSTCHNVHVPQRDLAAFAPRCQSCHKVEACKVFPRAGQKIATRCVDCHMPNLRSGAISIAGASTILAPEVRTHAIKIYRDASNAVLRTLVQ